LPAQNADDGEKPRAARGRLAWFVATSMPESLENPITVMSGKDIVEITLSKRSPSEPVKIPVDGILRVVRKLEEPAGPGKSPYVTLAQAVVGEGVSKALVIMIPAAKQQDGLLFNSTVHDLAKFKGGDWMFLNLTNVNVGVDMGKTKLEIKPSQTRIFEAPTLANPVNMPIRYRYFHPVQEDWKMLSASTIVLYPSRREICIFSVDPRYQRIEYHGISFPVSN
jgi:hypothetical protein